MLARRQVPQREALRLLEGGLGSPDGRSEYHTYGPAAPPLPFSDNVIELTAVGFDEQLQITQGADPYQNMTALGLRIPSLDQFDLAANTTPPTTSGATLRYLFLLATFSVPDREFARILGYRQYATIGLISTVGGPIAGGPNYVAELPIRTPSWHFPDGNISWHLQRLGAQPNIQLFPNPNAPANQIAQSAQYRFGNGPAFLYETINLGGNTSYVNLSHYTPPNQGRPWGKSLRAGMQTFPDMRSGQNYGQYVPLGDLVQGPDTIAFFASVWQTNPSTRPFLKIPGTAGPTTALTGGYTDEDAFVVNFPAALYWRVGGSLLVDMAPVPEDLNFR